MMTSAKTLNKLLGVIRETAVPNISQYTVTFGEESPLPPRPKEAQKSHAKYRRHQIFNAFILSKFYNKVY